MMRMKSVGPSQDVLVSFHSKWAQLLRAATPKVVFRLRIPTQPVRTMFFYVGVPIRAVIGKAAISEIRTLKADEACAYASQGAISKEELSQYISKHEKVGIYQIEDYVIFNKEIPLAVLKERFSFYAPQSFMYLSEEGVHFLQSVGLGKVQRSKA